MKILGWNVLREQELKVLLKDVRVFGSCQRSETNLLAIDGIGLVELLLDSIVLLLATFGNVDGENCAAEIGMDCVLIFAGCPSIESAFGFGDGSIAKVRISEGINVMGKNLRFVTSMASSGDEQLTKLTCQVILVLFEFPAEVFYGRGDKFAYKVFHTSSNLLVACENRSNVAE